MFSDQTDIFVESEPAGSDQRGVSDDIFEEPSLLSLGSVDDDQGGDLSVPDMIRQIILDLFFGDKREKLEDENDIKDVKDARIKSDIPGKSSVLPIQPQMESIQEALRMRQSKCTGLDYRY